MFCIAAEFAIAFWAAALLREKTDLDAATSTTLVLAYPLGMMIGRWFGTYVFPNLDIDERLKLIIALQGLSFSILELRSNHCFLYCTLFRGPGNLNAICPINASLIAFRMAKT